MSEAHGRFAGDGRAGRGQWRGFRGRLADRFAVLTDEDWLRIEPERAADSEGAASAFVQFASFGDTTAAR